MKFVTKCSLDLLEKIKTVPSLENKTLNVLSVDSLVNQIAHVVKPAAGVLYEGARGVSAEGGRQVGVSGEIVFSVILVSETSVLTSQVDTMTPTHELLDAVRMAIQGTRSPTGHFWKWMLEAPAASKANVQVWIQRWSCPVVLPVSI